MAQHFRDWGLGTGDADWAVVDDLLLIVSELLANVAHACVGPIGVHLDVHRTHVLVTVRDDSPAVAAEQRITVSSLGGRGLRIVSALSEKWGQTSYHDGSKQVWAKVRVPARSLFIDRCTR